MQPRLKTSQKWTVLPPELTVQMKAVLSESFAKHLDGRKVTADGRIYPGEILMLVGLDTPGRLRQEGFEISIAYAQPKDNVLKLLHLGMDAAGALFEQFFAAKTDEDFPRAWQKVDFEGREIFIQFTTVNNSLEAEANALLGLADADGVAQGEWEADIDASLVKAQLGLTEDDED